MSSETPINRKIRGVVQMFRDNLMHLLQQHHITALKLAQDTGIPKSIVYEWRNGVRLPNADNLSKLSRYFGVSLEALIGDGSEIAIPQPDGDEQDLIVLLRAARDVSGEERDQLIEKFQRSVKKYFDESDKLADISDKPRRGRKKRTPDQT
jgi:Helix-turn-helix.